MSTSCMSGCIVHALVSYEYGTNGIDMKQNISRAIEFVCRRMEILV